MNQPKTHFMKSFYGTWRVGFSLNYKIPCKNKQDKQEDILNNNTPQQKENTIGN